MDGIRKFQCCDPTVAEIKCLFKEKDLDLNILLLQPNVGGKKDEIMGISFLTHIIHIISKFRLARQFHV